MDDLAVLLFVETEMLIGPDVMFEKCSLLLEVQQLE